VSGARFITLEGGEGAGKSTQARRLGASLEARGIASVLTREPGGSPGAELVRKLLVEGERERWGGETETLLVFAARADHLARTIRPALAEGKWVICDRFVDSTYAYQGEGRGVARDFIAGLEQLVLHGFKPDLTLILDLDPAAGHARISARTHAETRFEKFGPDFHQRLRQSFRAIARANPDRCLLIDAARNEDEVASSIWHAVAKRFGI